MENQTESVIKIVITGDSGVGKTNLINRYVHDTFNEYSNPTVGLDFALKNTMIAGQNVSCQIWDTAGQEKMKAIASAYYKNANGAVLVFDIASKSSFHRLTYWLSELKDNLNENDISVILLGNKADLQDTREVAVEEAKSYAEANGFYYMEVSAKQNDNDCVTLAFDHLLSEINSKIQRKLQNKPQGTSFCDEDKGRKVETTNINERVSQASKKGCC